MNSWTNSEIDQKHWKLCFKKTKILGTYDVEDIDPFLCTHLMYGFAGLHSDDFTIKVLGRFIYITCI